MNITRKAEYALKAMTRIAVNHERGSTLTSINNISENENIPKKYLERILLELKNSGLLTSRRGIGGGYSLGRAPEEISLEEVIDIIDGPIAPLDCVIENGLVKCPALTSCGLYGVMIEVRSAISKVLSDVSLRELARRSIELLEKTEGVPSYVI